MPWNIVDYKEGLRVKVGHFLEFDNTWSQYAFYYMDKNSMNMLLIFYFCVPQMKQCYMCFELD